MRNVILGALLFLISTVTCFAIVIARTEIRATEEICQLVQDNYYRIDQPDVQAFLKRCAADSVPFTFKRSRAIKNINRRLSLIRSSHLSVYAPSETRRIWENEGSDTGLRSRMIDGELVVTGTLPESPARRADLQAGDVVVTINDQAPTTEDDAQTTSGFYKIARDRKVFQTSLKLEDLREDLSPSIVRLTAGTAVLRLPSFLPQYFENETWAPLANELMKYKNVVVDLRGNAGGSFPAMLRALSAFGCKVRKIGELWRTPRGELKELTDRPMLDNLDAASQLELFESVDTIRLDTFGSVSAHACFEGDVVVLIDSRTSSVSEIFANAMLSRPNTKVWGSTTAGQVVMARWFSIGSLGGGDYSISIPIAGYRYEKANEIEQKGVSPTKDLYYDLETALRGEDSWINSSSKSFAR